MKYLTTILAASMLAMCTTTTVTNPDGTKTETRNFTADPKVVKALASGIAEGVTSGAIDAAKNK